MRNFVITRRWCEDGYKYTSEKYFQADTFCLARKVFLSDLNKSIETRPTQISSILTDVLNATSSIKTRLSNELETWELTELQ